MMKRGNFGKARAMDRSHNKENDGSFYNKLKMLNYSQSEKNMVYYTIGDEHDRKKRTKGNTAAISCLSQGIAQAEKFRGGKNYVQGIGECCQH